MIQDDQQAPCDFLGRAAHANDDAAVRFLLSKVFLSQGLKVSAIVRHERALLTGREGQLLLVIFLFLPASSVVST